MFNPVDLDETVTLDAVIEKLKQSNFNTALLMALKLQSEEITEKVYQCVPLDSLPLICANFPQNYLDRLLSFLAT